MRSFRCFHVVLAVALVGVAFMALVPHHETEDASCAVCKAGNQTFCEPQPTAGPRVEGPVGWLSLPEPVSARPALLPADNASRAPPV